MVIPAAVAAAGGDSWDQLAWCNEGGWVLLHWACNMWNLACLFTLLHRRKKQMTVFKQLKKKDKFYLCYYTNILQYISLMCQTNDNL